MLGIQDLFRSHRQSRRIGYSAARLALFDAVKQPSQVLLSTMPQRPLWPPPPQQCRQAVAVEGDLKLVSIGDVLKTTLGDDELPLDAQARCTLFGACLRGFMKDLQPASVWMIALPHVKTTEMADTLLTRGLPRDKADYALEGMLHPSSSAIPDLAAFIDSHADRLCEEVVAHLKLAVQPTPPHRPLSAPQLLLPLGEKEEAPGGTEITLDPDMGKYTLTQAVEEAITPILTQDYYNI